MLIYVAGRHSDESDACIERNIANARRVAILLWEKGHAVICPHLNSIHMERDCKATYEDYMRGDFNMIARVDAMVMVPGWEQSKGACREKEYAESLGVPVWCWPEHPDVHLTERVAPEQCQGFREIVGKMYRVHLSKNADYSSANVLGPGEIGLVVRLWDKVTRLMSLAGFTVEVSYSQFDKPRKPQHEAIEDTFLDLAVYGIIGLLLRAGKWGK